MRKNMRSIILLAIGFCLIHLSFGCSNNIFSSDKTCDDFVAIDDPCFGGGGGDEPTEIPQCISSAEWQIMLYETKGCEDYGYDPNCCTGGACEITPIGDTTSCPLFHSCLDKYEPTRTSFAVCGLKKCTSSNELAYFYYDTQWQSPALQCNEGDKDKYLLYPDSAKKCPDNQVCVSSGALCIPDECKP
jgi:hypothetical protein